MGKVGKIVLGAVGLAVLFVPGIGAAITGAIYGGLAGGAVGAAAAAALTLGQAIAAGLTLYGLSTAFSLVTSLFTHGAPKPVAAERQVRSPTPTRTYLCGIRRSFGALIGFFRASDGSAVDVLAFFDGRMKSVVRTYLNDDQVTISGGFVQALGDGSYGGSNVKAGHSLGAATETAFSAVVSALPGIWTSAHRGDGVACGYLIKTPVKQKEFLNIYPQGDNVTFSIVYESWYLYDPREAAQDWDDDDTWSGPIDNPVLGLLRYLVIERGEDYATRIEPVIDYWTAAADICDSLRSLKAGGSEKLYRCAIMYDSSAKPSEIIAEFLKSFDGWMGEDGDGHIIIYAGQLYVPSVTVDETMIVDYEVKNFVEDEDRVNEAVVTYVSSLHDYSIVEATPWRDEADITERGRIVSVPFEPQVPSHAQSQYLARRLAAKTNAQYSGTISTNYSGRSVIGHRYINLTVEEAGATFYDGLAEILTLERNPQTGGVVFTWSAVSAALDDWTPATDEGDPAPVGSGVSITALAAPTIISVIPILSSDSGAGTTGARLQVTAAGPTTADLTWFVRWRVDGETLWSQEIFADETGGSTVTLLTQFVPVYAGIEVQAAYMAGDGRVSPWSATAGIGSVNTADTTLMTADSTFGDASIG